VAYRAEPVFQELKNRHDEESARFANLKKGENK
jgi:hypothetical protein